MYLRTFGSLKGKFAEIFASQGAQPISTTPVSPVTPAANFSTSFAIVIDTGGKQLEQLSNS
jgi:hypothetical protein